MSTIIQGNELRTLRFGRRTSKATGTLAATTISLFTVTGGRVGITSIYGIVTTSVTVANSYKLQFNPTLAGATTVDLCAATDIGTTDTPAGDMLGFTGAANASITRGGAVESLRSTVVLTNGDIESVSAGTDGNITWVVTWEPLDDGAQLVAA
jgi:hypothetical protein